MPEEITSATLTDADRRVLSQALGQMPYVPLVPGVSCYGLRAGTGPTLDGKTVETVADFAEIIRRVATVVADYGTRHLNTEYELRVLRADVAAVRRVLGGQS